MRKLKLFAAGILSASLMFGMASSQSIRTEAAGKSVSYDFTTPGLAGRESELLLQNPNRGLRMEVYLDVATGKSLFEYADADAFEELERQIAYYESDQPQLIQVYFYLTGYKDKPLDETAFNNMNRFFEKLEEHNLKAVLRFAYIWDDNDWEEVKQEPTVDQLEAHMVQLKDFIKNHEEQIHVLQMGLVGAWGEWDSGARERLAKLYGADAEQRIVNSVLKNTPEDMYLQVRYQFIKNSFVDKNDTVNWNRVGYHDDYLIGYYHDWNTAGGNPESEGWKQMTEESKNLLVDGEMVWGAGNKWNLPYEEESINPWWIAWRMREHHFTSLSLTHNYKETNKGPDSDGCNFSMMDWQKEFVDAETMQDEEYLFEPNWFKDKEGNDIERSMFEFIRDHLGYYLKAETAEAVVDEESVNVDVTMKNYGFAAPIGLKSIDLVMLDADGNEADRVKACELNELQPGEEVTIQKTFAKPEADGRYTLAIDIRAKDGTPARLANDSEFVNGYNVMGDVEVKAMAAPQAPVEVKEMQAGKDFVTFKFAPSADSAKVVGYKVYSGTEVVADVENVIGEDGLVEAKVTGLKAGTTYKFLVKAYDADGNLSEEGMEFSITTEKAAVTEPDNGQGSNNGQNTDNGQKQSAKSPETGDASNILVILLAMCGSAVIMAGKGKEKTF